MSRILEYFKSDLRDFALQISTILEEFGATPEVRSRPSFVPSDPYEQIAALRARVQELEETLRHGVGTQKPGPGFSS
jgi:hypothetical protein